MPTVFSANRSNVQITTEEEGAQPIEGLQSLAFRVVTEREDVRAVGSDERVDVSFGLRTVQGELLVRSVNETLDGLLSKQSRFDLVAILKKDEGEASPKENAGFRYLLCGKQIFRYGCRRDGSDHLRVQRHVRARGITLGRIAPHSVGRDRLQGRVPRVRRAACGIGRRWRGNGVPALASSPTLRGATRLYSGPYGRSRSRLPRICASREHGRRATPGSGVDGDRNPRIVGE
jgi:hypothetical protein